VSNYITNGFAASQGFIRVPNGGTIVAARSNSFFDLVILSTDFSNNVLYGDANNAGQIFNTGTGNEHLFEVNSIANLHIGNTYLSFDSSN
ncbi:hypothetical protein, partial [Enterococcus faecalis]|uniref:hypothetical protein n=1 Tax=Enterococcus faecalis TaxID=1351 RepID=UPI00403F572D